jgi:acylglycerol lipase
MFRILMFLVLAAAVAATGAYLKFGDTPDHPACGPEPAMAGGEGVTVSHLRFAAPDGVCLQRYEWKSASAAPRGVVVIVHGIRDHGQRYAALAVRLATAGFVVYASDLRGHGLSGGAPQLFRSIPELVADADLTVAEAKKSNPGLPVFLYGHSLGGLIVATYTRTHGERIQGAVLSGAALKLAPDVSAATQWVARTLGGILPSLPLQPVDDTIFVRTEGTCG